MKTNFAYTFIEILLVLALMSIFAALSWPNLYHYYTGASDKAMMVEFVQLLQFAQLESSARHQAMGVCRADSNGKCQSVWAGKIMVFIDVAGDGSIIEREQVVRTASFMHATGTMHWRSYPYYRDYLLFMPDGALDGDNGTFWYCHQRAAVPAFAIILSKSGIARAVLPDKSGAVRDASGNQLACNDSSPAIS